MQYSPKLKMAMEEIKDIAKKYDIAMIAVLHNAENTFPLEDGSIYTEGFSEYIFHISPSYSAASLGTNGRFVVLGKSSHYNSKEQRDNKMAATFNMFEHLAQWTGRLAMQAMDMHEAVKKIVEELPTDPGTHTSHDQQNN